MKDEYIRREDAIDKINERQRKLIYCFGFENDAVKIMDIAKSIVIAIPSAQPELKSADVAPVIHSRWIKTADGAECEICGREAVYQIVDDHWEYEPWCPHCGAKMAE